MKAIKFRAWDKAKKEYTAVGFHIIGETTLFDLLNQYSVEALNDIEIEQFTGMLDRNGKEVYEGDIISLDPTKPDIETIAWNEQTGAFCGEWVVRNGETKRSDHIFGIHLCTVIGNIHEGVKK
jgi:uncharacterized phage protein (TIGR01671 family)